MVAKGGIRWQIRRDLPSVLEIEKLCFPEPWSEEDILAVQRQRNCIGMVYEEMIQGKPVVVAFMVYELHKTALRILNFAVHPKHQRKGYGTKLFSRLQDKLQSQRRHQIETEVRDDNIDAQFFFQKMGMRGVRVIRGTPEDYYLMIYAIPVDPSVYLEESHQYHPRNRISQYLSEKSPSQAEGTDSVDSV